MIYKNLKLSFLSIQFLFIQFIFPALDPTFGSGGIVTTSLGLLDYINGVSLESTTTNIVVGGVRTTNAAIKLAVARYTPSGSLDSTFNGIGFNTLLVGSRTEGNAIDIQEDNKSVIAGFAYESQSEIIVTRYDTSGSLDTTFNGIGYVTTTTGGGAAAYAVKIQSDNKIVIGGAAVEGIPKFIVARYDSTGSLDATFGDSGIVFTQIGMIASISDIAIQQDGKIVAAGYANDGAMNIFAVARYNTDGSLDTGFGSGGVVTTAINSDAKIQGVALQADGKVVVAGYTIASTIYKFALARYTTSGVLDTTFNGTGIVVTQIDHQDQVNAVVLQADGKIVVAAFNVGDVSIQFAVARYNTDGTLDTSFGTNGIELTTIGGVDSDSEINAAVIQPDEKIVVAGFSNRDFALARYLP